MIRLTDGQWKRIRNHFSEENIPDSRAGRKPVSTRRVLEAVLWILNTGAQWHMLPQSYPNYKTAYRRFQTWCRDEVLRRALTDVVAGRLDLSQPLDVAVQAILQISTVSTSAVFSVASER